MDSKRMFKLATTNKSRTKAVIHDCTAQVPLYTLDLSFITTDLSKHSGYPSITMYDARPNSSSQTPVVGICNISFLSLSRPIHIGFGDPNASIDEMIWEDIHCQERMTTNGFSLHVDLGGELGRKQFCWKRTHDIDGVGAAKRKLDWLHLKMVESESDEVVALFIHNPMLGSTRGTFELENFNGGRNWEVIVLLSGSAVLEYMRKASGWSW